MHSCFFTLLSPNHPPLPTYPCCPPISSPMRPYLFSLPPLLPLTAATATSLSRLYVSSPTRSCLPCPPPASTGLQLHRWDDSPPVAFPTPPALVTLSLSHYSYPLTPPTPALPAQLHRRAVLPADRVLHQPPDQWPVRPGRQAGRHLRGTQPCFSGFDSLSFQGTVPTLSLVATDCIHTYIHAYIHALSRLTPPCSSASTSTTWWTCPGTTRM
jgi:hypothetical protein